MFKKCMKTMNWAVLVVAILAAVWMIISPDVLKSLGLTNEKLIDVLAYVPAIGVIIFAASTNSEAAACEKRLIKRLFRKT